MKIYATLRFIKTDEDISQEVCKPEHIDNCLNDIIQKYKSKCYNVFKLSSKQDTVLCSQRFNANSSYVAEQHYCCHKVTPGTWNSLWKTGVFNFIDIEVLN